jgi:hypothetical protein
LLACAASCLGVTARAALAQAPAAQVPPQAEPAAVAAEPPEYRAAIDEAVVAFANQDWPAARVAFARAHSLSPSARTLRGLGLSLFYLRDYAGARVAIEQALLDARKPLSPEQRDELERFLRSAKLETGRYELRIDPANARATIDAMQVVSHVVVLPRGAHDMQVTADGYVTQRTVLDVKGGEDTVLVLGLSKDASSLTLPLTVSPPPADTGKGIAVAPAAPQPSARPRVFTWVALAGVPVFGGIGIGVWFAGKNKYDEIAKTCRDTHCDTKTANALADKAHLSRYSTWSTVAGVTAGASAVAAIVLFFVEGQRTSESDANAKGATSLLVTPSDSGASLAMRF